MIGRIRGEVVERSAGVLIVDCGGVGYEVHVPERTAANARDTIILSIYTDVREDDIVLYGFDTAEERALFTKLRQVKNVGPSKSLALLSGFTPDVVVKLIESGDTKALAKAPGIGPGTANNLVHELKGKLGGIAIVSLAAHIPKVEDGFALALAQLGYKRSEIDAAVAFLAESGQLEAPLGDRIRLSLGRLSPAR